VGGIRMDVFSSRLFTHPTGTLQERHDNSRVCRGRGGGRQRPNGKRVLEGRVYVCVFGRCVALRFNTY
jgi:hypothetical protein